jgi:hypothetical protein
MLRFVDEPAGPRSPGAGLSAHRIKSISSVTSQPEHLDLFSHRSQGAASPDRLLADLPLTSWRAGSVDLVVLPTKVVDRERSNLLICG